MKVCNYYNSAHTTQWAEKSGPPNTLKLASTQQGAGRNQREGKELTIHSTSLTAGENYRCITVRSQLCCQELASTLKQYLQATLYLV